MIEALFIFKIQTVNFFVHIHADARKEPCTERCLEISISIYLATVVTYATMLDFFFT